VSKRRTRRAFLSELASGAACGVISGLIPGCGALQNLSSSSQPGAGSPPTQYSVDVVVSGATPSGIMAAQSALREGATVAIFESTRHIGGMLTNGLMTDMAYPQGVGGLTAKFYRDVGKYYGLTSGQPQYVFEPHAAESIFTSYLNSPNCSVILGRTITSVRKSGTQIKSVTLDNGSTVEATQWVDASYEGDLMAAANVSYATGREAKSQYLESHAGWGNQSWHSLNAFDSDGILLPGINADPHEASGEADEKIMAYTFRNCISADRSNMAPFPMPANYDRGRFDLTSRVIAMNGSTELAQVLTLQPGVNEKFCLLSVGWGSTDYIGGSWGYPNGSWTIRNEILRDHYDYVAGLLYFLSNDNSVPLTIRNQLGVYGLPLDEFTDNEHWPWRMYVREGRRLVGDYVMVQADITTSPSKNDAIGLGAWAFDSHGCDLFATAENGMQGTALDGSFYITNVARAYQLPFRSILPQPSDVTNLAISVCVSASHIAYSSIRIEPTFMILGEAAGTAAVMALSQGIDVSEVDSATLQKNLLSYGAVLALPQ
jgi:hypothetical protein